MSFATNNGRLASIDALRAFGALSVLLMHCIWLGPWELPRSSFVWFHHGWLGVDLFLVISGFATTLALQAQLQKGGASSTYWLHRLVRIFPLYLITSIFFLIAVDASAILGNDGLFQIATHATLTHGLFPSAAGSINGVTWTLSLELQLYLAGFLLIVWHQKRGKPIGLQWILIVFSMGLAYRYTIYQLCASQAQMSQASHWITQMPGLCEGFLLGVLIAQNADKLGVEKRFHIKPSLLFLLGLLMSALLIVLLEANRAAYWQSWHFPVLFRPAIAASFALIVWAAAQTTKPATSIWLRLLAQLGTYSYGIYLWHLPILLLLKQAGFINSGLFLATLSCTILLAALSYHGVERPLMRWIKIRRIVYSRI